MRILFIIDSLARAGAETSTALLATSLHVRGHECEFAILYERPGLRESLTRDGIPIWLAASTNPLGRLRRLSRIVGARQPDIIHTCLWESDQLGRLAGRRHRVPVVTTWAGMSSAGPMTPFHQLAILGTRVLDALTGNFVAMFHAVTPEIEKVMRRRTGVGARRVRVIARGRDSGLLGMWSTERRAAVRLGLGIEPTTPVLLCIARHEPVKGLDQLLRALPATTAEFPNLILLCAGREGSGTSTIQALIKSLHMEGHVRLLGDREDVADLLVAADVFVCSSRSEGAGGALMEAMALRCPIVAADLRSLRHTAAPNEAVFVNAEIPARLASAVVDSLQNGEAARARSAQAYEAFTTKFDLDVVATEMESFYRAAIDPRPERRTPPFDRMP